MYLPKYGMTLISFKNITSKTEYIINYLPTPLISLGADIAVEELLHPVLPQYFVGVWHVFLHDFVDK